MRCHRFLPSFTLCVGVFTIKCVTLLFSPLFTIHKQYHTTTSFFKNLIHLSYCITLSEQTLVTKHFSIRTVQISNPGLILKETNYLTIMLCQAFVGMIINCEARRNKICEHSEINLGIARWILSLIRSLCSAVLVLYEQLITLYRIL